MKRIFILLTVFLPVVSLQAQEYRWKVDFDYFFDNMEYKKSSFMIPQTQNGIWLTPSGGIHWDSTHTVYTGVNLLKIPGSSKTLDKTMLTLYYQYEIHKVLCRVGIFPRKEVLSNYSDFFFKDSINHFNPLMQGIFFRVGGKRNFVNGWLDWTSYADETQRESFFLGFSGKTSKKNFFADFQSYLFHYSGTLPWNPLYDVAEQFQGLASVGFEYENDNSLRTLASVGVFGGIERDRKWEEVHKSLGLVLRVNAEYMALGVQNTFYRGDPRMWFYETYGDNLYWGTQFLRAKSYLQSKWYINLLQSSWVKILLNMNLHFSEGEVMFQQTLSVSASVDNFSKPESRKIRYPWINIFKR